MKGHLKFARDCGVLILCICACLYVVYVVKNYVEIVETKLRNYTANEIGFCYSGTNRFSCIITQGVGFDFVMATTNLDFCGNIIIRNGTNLLTGTLSETNCVWNVSERYGLSEKAYYFQGPDNEVSLVQKFDAGSNQLTTCEVVMFSPSNFHGRLYSSYVQTWYNTRKSNNIQVVAREYYKK